MSDRTVIVAVLYEEPEYAATRAAIEACGVPTVWVDRKGVGSLARAYNAGFAEAMTAGRLPGERARGGFDFAWFVSNIAFPPQLLPRLEAELSARPDFAALQPTYSSDHAHLRFDPALDVAEVPFVEFTCPLVRTGVFAAHSLDEAMPYWGHDLDWSHRVRQAGWKLGVDHRAPIVGHTYIRLVENPHPVTQRRHRLRRQASPATERALVQKYGPDWRQVVEYAG